MVSYQQLNVTVTTNNTPANLSSSNSGEDWKSELSVTGKSLISTLIIIIDIVIVMGNGLVVAAFCQDKKLHILRNYYIFNLAIADLITGLISMPLYLPTIWYSRWLLGNTMCIIWLSMDYNARMVSMVTIAMITHDRYIMVTKPIKHRSKQHKKSALIKIALTWISAFLIRVPAIIIGEMLQTHDENDQGGCSCDPYIGFEPPFIFRIPEYDITYTYITFALMEFLLPLATVFYFNIQVYRAVKRRFKRGANYSGDVQNICAGRGGLTAGNTNKCVCSLKGGENVDDKASSDWCRLGHAFTYHSQSENTILRRIRARSLDGEMEVLGKTASQSQDLYKKTTRDGSSVNTALLHSMRNGRSFSMDDVISHQDSSRSDAFPTETFSRGLERKESRQAENKRQNNTSNIEAGGVKGHAGRVDGHAGRVKGHAGGVKGHADASYEEMHEPNKIPHKRKPSKKQLLQVAPSTVQSQCSEYRAKCREAWKRTTFNSQAKGTLNSVVKPHRGLPPCSLMREKLTPSSNSTQNTATGTLTDLQCRDHELPTKHTCSKRREKNRRGYVRNHPVISINQNTLDVPACTGRTSARVDGNLEIHTISTQVNNNNSNNSTGQESEQGSHRNNKTASTITLLILMFVALKSPYSVAMMIRAVEFNLVSIPAHEIFTWLYWSKSLVNPFLYTFMSHSFRQYCRSLVSKLKGKCCTDC